MSGLSARELRFERGSSEHHPLEDFLRMDRMPHIWCSTCGLGTMLTAFIAAVMESELSRSDIAIVSGIGCTGRAAGYLRFDSFHTTHGRALPFATGLKLANPKLKVVVISGDGDIVSIGGNHLIHAARRNLDLTVICVNNFNYAMTGGQVAPTTPETALMTTAPYGSFEHPFNIPFLVDSCGATYVARWTALHVRQLTVALKEALLHRGFSFVEVISPCPTVYGRRNRLGSGLDLMKFYREHSITKDGCDTREVDIRFQEDIIVGRFVQKEKPTFLDSMEAQMRRVLKDGFVPYAGPMEPA
uniref:2-oxoacid:ferredoxin oxidoreductase subunit beta n=1 Tax=candidate division WOR-3 bacterium TaxID=2052148 RepID=A0A7C4CB27_UNCW3